MLIGALATAAVLRLGTAQVAAIATTAVSGLTTDQIGVLSSAQADNKIGMEAGAG